MALYLKLEIHAGTGGHAYVTSFKLRSAGVLLPYSDFAGIESSPPYSGSISGTLNDGSYPQSILFYAPDSGYIIYRYDGVDVPDELALDTYNGFSVSSFDLYTVESETVPSRSDPGWQHVISQGSYQAGTTELGDPSNYMSFGTGVTVSKYLFRIGTFYYRYDIGAGFTLVSEDLPSADQFAESGMTGVVDIDVDDVLVVNAGGDFGVEYFNSAATDTDSLSLTVTTVPEAQIAVPAGTITLTGTESLDGIAITQTLSGTGVSRFAVSVDGSDWQTWGGAAWQPITGLTVDTAGADRLIANGMTAAELQALTWAELQQLYAGAPTTIAIAYAVEAQAVDDVAAIDLVELTVTHAGQWVRDHGQIELALSAESVTATPAIDCSYKINYQDA